jgi:hypothetical protein
MRGHNELLSAVLVGCLLGVFTNLLFTLPMFPPGVYNNSVQQEYGR